MTEKKQQHLILFLGSKFSECKFSMSPGEGAGVTFFGKGAGVKKGDSDHRCRSRQSLGVAKDFCLNFHKLAPKVFMRLGLQIFSHKDREELFFVWPPKKGLHVLFCKCWVPFFEIKQCCVTFLPRFSGILPKVSTNQNFWGALAPPPPAPLTPITFGPSLLAHSTKALYRVSRRSSVAVFGVRCFLVSVKTIIWKRPIFQFLLVAACALVHSFWSWYWLFFSACFCASTFHS